MTYRTNSHKPNPSKYQPETSSTPGDHYDAELRVVTKELSDLCDEGFDFLSDDDSAMTFIAHMKLVWLDFRHLMYDGDPYLGDRKIVSDETFFAVESVLEKSHQWHAKLRDKLEAIRAANGWDQ